MRVDLTALLKAEMQLLKQVRKDMLAGKRSEHCLRCNREDDAKASRRDLEINLNFKEFTLEDAQAVTAEDGSIVHEAVDITSDIRLSNFCNLKCFMCGPESLVGMMIGLKLKVKSLNYGTELELEKGAKNRFNQRF